jgi:hypothetical protein
LPVLAVRANYSDSNEQVISVKITNVTFEFWGLAARAAAFWEMSTLAHKSRTGDALSLVRLQKLLRSAGLLSGRLLEFDRLLAPRTYCFQDITLACDAATVGLADGICERILLRTTSSGVYASVEVE